MDDVSHISHRVFLVLNRYNVFRWLGDKIFGARINSVAGLTIRAAVRFKLFPVLFVFLMLIVHGLPRIIKDDGTARGLTQILLTYTLGLITVVLGLSTLWLACGTLARDMEECQMQVVAVKPIARWQIWIGKWVGLMALNAVLLGASGLSVYSLVLWRAAKLPAQQQLILRNEVLIGRGSFKPPVPDLEPVVQENVRQIMGKAEQPISDRKALEDTIRTQVKAMYQAVRPGTAKMWQIDLGMRKNQLRDQPLYVRLKFITSESRAAVSNPRTYPIILQVGPPETPLAKRVQLSLPSETFYELPIPPNIFDENGILTIVCGNPTDNLALIFPDDDGMEVLYRESGFGLNFARGIMVIYLWLALLAILGLAAASFLSFPVAAFLSLSVLLVALASGTLSTAVTDGNVTGTMGSPDKPLIDQVLLPVFRMMVKVVNLAQDFSPIDSLSSGRSITWVQLGRAFGQIVVLLGGLIGAFGIYVFNRRELATAQGQQ